MANSTEVVFWPVAFLLGVAMLALVFSISTQVENETQASTSETITEVAAQSHVYTLLNLRRGGDKFPSWRSEGTDPKKPVLPGYVKLSYKWCGNDNNLEKTPVKSNVPNSIDWMKITADVPSLCGNSGEKTVLTTGRKSKDRTESYSVKIPVRGGKTIDLQARYHGDTDQ